MTMATTSHQSVVSCTARLALSWSHANGLKSRSAIRSALRSM